VLKTKKAGLNRQNIDMKTLIELTGVCKSYSKKGLQLPVLDSINLQVEEGDFIALLGKSGSGKSSLLNILGLLDNFNSGGYRLMNNEMRHHGEKALARIRNRHIGFIFQSYNLLPFKTALENTALPLYYRGMAFKQRMERARNCLQVLGMEQRLDHYPAELSGGECQRVAIARALAGNPELILADEPTGALDSKNSLHIMDLLRNLNQNGNTIIIVTHDNAVAANAKRIITIEDGRIIN
jgi:putative ABC transport system ATP-binding protein